MMRAADFLSTPDDLLETAIRYGEHFARGGWEVVIEPFDLAFPRTPVFGAHRDHTTLLIEVQPTLDVVVLEEWGRYCRSCANDTRVIVCLDSFEPPDGSALARLRTSGIGLMLLSDEGPFELVPSLDLALNIELPELPDALKPLLGAAYDLFHKGEWREGFENACTRLEQQARKYLEERVSRGGAQFVGSNGSVKVYAVQRIATMTLGQLAVAFQEMRSPNVADSRLGQALKTVNDERITAAHYKGVAPEREQVLRRTVARNMFVVVNGLQYALGMK